MLPCWEHVLSERKKQHLTIGAFTQKKKGPHIFSALTGKCQAIFFATLLLSGAFVTTAPATASTEPKQQATTAEGFPRLLFIGDSLTEGYGVTKNEAYPHLVAQQLKAKGFPKLSYVNSGASGATSSIGPKMVAFHTKKRRPDLVIYALGSNDGLRGVQPTATRKKIEAALDLLKKQGIPVLLTGQRAAPNYGPKYTAAFDSMFAAIAKERSLPFLPFLLKGVAADPKLNLADGIHPNPEGHKVIASRVAAAIAPLLKALPASAAQHQPSPKL